MLSFLGLTEQQASLIVVTLEWSNLEGCVGIRGVPHITPTWPGLRRESVCHSLFKDLRGLDNIP